MAQRWQIEGLLWSEAIHVANAPIILHIYITGIRNSVFYYLVPYDIKVKI